MASIKIDLREVFKGLSRIKGGFEDMTPFYRAVAEKELKETRLRFKNEVDPDGNKWPDSKTIRRGGGDPRNPKKSRFTRDVREARQDQKLGGAAVDVRAMAWNYVLASHFHGIPPGWHWFDRSRGDKVLRDTGVLFSSIGMMYGKDFAIIGTNVSYAKNHQEGLGVERRQFLGINEKTYKNINDAMTSYLKGVL